MKNLHMSTRKLVPYLVVISTRTDQEVIDLLLKSNTQMTRGGMYFFAHAQFVQTVTHHYLTTALKILNLFTFSFKVRDRAEDSSALCDPYGSILIVWGCLFRSSCRISFVFSSVGEEGILFEDSSC